MTLELGEGFRLGEGRNVWSNIHIHDLSELIAALVDAAAKGKTAEGLWRKDAIYFPENGEMVHFLPSPSIISSNHTSNT